MPDELFLDDEDLKRRRLEKDFEQAKLDDNLELAIEIRNTIKELDSINDNNKEESLVPDKDLVFRYQEYKAFSQKTESEINIDKKNEHLKVKDVTENLDSGLSIFFSKILRVDNMKLTTAQLDFSRVVPDDSDGNGIVSKNIFRSFPKQVEAYPVVENYGEGIFFAFSPKLLENYAKENEAYIESFNLQLEALNEGSSRFSKGAR